MAIASGTNTVDLSGLTSDQSYTWTAYRDSDCPDTGKIDDVTFATRKPLKPPTKPTVAAGSQQVTLASSTSTNSGPAITKWRYVRKTGNNTFETTRTDIPGSGASTTTYIVTGLTNGTAYRFKVRAVNAIGAGAASPESDPATPAAAAVVAPVARRSGAWATTGACPAARACRGTAAWAACTSGSTCASGTVC